MRKKSLIYTLTVLMCIQLLTITLITISFTTLTYRFAEREINSVAENI